MLYSSCFRLSLHSISHNALLFLLTEKDNLESPCSVLGRKQSDVVTSECFCVVCVSISIVDLFTKSFWRVSVPLWWSHTCYVLFISSFRCYGLEKRAAPLPLLLLDFLGQTVRPVWTWTHTQNVSAEKKLKKKNKRSCICSDFVLFIKTKNTDAERSGQRIKSLFFILYIWKSRFQYVALLCCTNQMCLWHFSNLIYFTVSFCFCFLLHH